MGLLSLNALAVLRNTFISLIIVVRQRKNGKYKGISLLRVVYC